MKVDDKTAGRIIVLSGPSGSGKTTIVGAACEREPLLQRVPTATTRARRPGEVDGESYLFMDEDEFSAREEEGLFLETACVHGNHYGTPRNAVDAFLEHGLIPICILDPAGAASVRAAYPGQVMSIFVDASDQELRRRLEERVGAEDVDRRMADAASFRSHRDEYDAVLENEQGNLQATVHEFIGICEQSTPTFAGEDLLDTASLGKAVYVNERTRDWSSRTGVQFPELATSLVMDEYTCTPINEHNK